MKIILNNSIIQFNSADYDWAQIPVSAEMFPTGESVCSSSSAGNYLGCALLNNPDKRSNSGTNDYIDVSNYSKVKFDVIASETLGDYSPGYCFYDDYIDITWYAGHTIYQHVVGNGCFQDDVKTFKTVIVDVPANAKCLRFTLPASYNAEDIAVYGIEKTEGI